MGADRKQKEIERDIEGDIGRLVSVKVKCIKRGFARQIIQFVFYIKNY